MSYLQTFDFVNMQLPTVTTSSADESLAGYTYSPYKLEETIKYTCHRQHITNPAFLLASCSAYYKLDNSILNGNLLNGHCKINPLTDGATDFTTHTLPGTENNSIIKVNKLIF